MKNLKHSLKAHAILKRLILVNLCCISIGGKAGCKGDGGSLTPDGNCFIFARGIARQNSIDLYWVKSSFIENLK